MEPPIIPSPGVPNFVPPTEPRCRGETGHRGRGSPDSLIDCTDTDSANPSEPVRLECFLTDLLFCCGRKRIRSGVA